MSSDRDPDSVDRAPPDPLPPAPAPFPRSSAYHRRTPMPMPLSISSISHLRDSSSPSHSETYEDAQSEPFILPDGTMPRRGSSVGPESHFARRQRSASEFSELEPLPPLEPYLPEAGSLDGSILENDLLPSTPLTDEQMRHADSVLKEDLHGVTINRIEDDPDADADYWGYDIRGMMHNAAEQAEEFAIAIWHKLQSWKVIHFSSLPQWLQDNDFLHFGHRPPLPTVECFKSIIRIHTETGNIWTHLLGVVAFLGLASYFVSRPLTEVQVQEKLVFSCFFLGAIVCLGLSFLYHTLCCHKDKDVGRLFAKFDYCGIAFLTVGSFVPWLYYSFYCDWKPQVIYLSVVITLGFGAVIVSTFDFFAGPKFRPLRAAVFIFFGLSGIAPATHYAILNGWEKSLEEAALGWLSLMGLLYITGAVLYAVRVPERFFPGKLDIWFHSHQIFHCFVMAGAFVHYHGISIMAIYRLKKGECPVDPSVEDCLLAGARNSTSLYVAPPLA